MLGKKFSIIEKIYTQNSISLIIIIRNEMKSTNDSVQK